MYQLFTDTDTDITPEIAEQYGYQLISMPYSMHGKDIYPYVDFVDFDHKAFYDELRGGVIPKTFGLSPQNYIEYFEPYLKEGKDILYIHFSSAMSGTFNSMKLAWEDLKEKYPERNLYTIDTKSISIGSYNIVCEIGKMAQKGATAQEILDWAKIEVDKFAVYFFSEDLKFFARSGRVSNISAVMGSLLGIRPIISTSTDGEMKSIAKAQGRRGAIKKLIEYVEKLQENIKDYPVVIGHADAFDAAQELSQKLKERFGEDLQVIILMVNPTLGAHCGPGTVGVCFHAIHR